MKIGIITFEKKENRKKDSCGSSRIRGRWLWQNWDEAEEYQIGQSYDCLIFQKAYWLDMAREFGGWKIFDLCDPDFLDGRPVIEMISYCHAVVTSTPALAEYLKKLVKDKPCLCIPDRVELKEHLPYQKKEKEHIGRAKKVVWFGYSHNAWVLDRTYPFLKELGLKIRLISDQAIVPIEGFKNYENVKYSYPKVHKDLTECDFALLPTYPPGDFRGKFKSNNKTLTCWALKLPVARIPDDLTRFLDAEERRKEARKRWKEVKEKWDVKLSVQEYRNLIQRLMSGEFHAGKI